MPGIFAAALKFFEEDGWPYQVVKPQSTLQMQFQGENGQWSCFGFAKEQQEQFAFYSVCPVRPSEDKRLALAEFLTRANYGLALGNFELDFSDGEIRYKTSLDVEGDRLTSALIKHIVYSNVMMMDTYLPGIMLVIYGNATPEDAIARIENKEEPQPEQEPV